MTQTHRFKVDKLIRDEMPLIMRASGIKVLERVLPKDEYLNSLKDKLIEEAKEVIASNSKKEICEEMGDLLEVMLAILKAHDVDFEDVKQIAKRKKSEKGGFDNRIYNDFVEIEESNPSIEYYRSRPDQYPEIK